MTNEQLQTLLTTTIGVLAFLLMMVGLLFCTTGETSSAMLMMGASALMGLTSLAVAQAAQ